MDFDLQYFNDQGQRDPNGLNILGLHWVEVNTEMITKAVLRANADRGTASMTAFFDKAAGVGISNTGKKWLGVKNAEDFWWIPTGTRQLRVEGRRESPATLVSIGIGPIV